MNNYNWQELSLLDDIDIDDVGEVNDHEQNRRAKSNERKRKWREIETIKEQRRLRRDMDYFEHHAY